MTPNFNHPKITTTNKNNNNNKREFSPLLRTVQKPAVPIVSTTSHGRNINSATKRTTKNGLLTYDEIELTDSMESFHRNNSTIQPNTTITLSPSETRRQKQPGRLTGNDASEPIPLRQQENLLAQYKNENFGLKMKLFLLTQRLEQQTPQGLQELTKENIELKTQVKQLAALNMELKEQATRSSYNSNSSVSNQKVTVEDNTVIEELKMEIKDLKSNLRVKENEVSDLERKIKGLQDTDIDNRYDNSAIIHEKESEIESLKGQLEDLELQLKDYKSDLNVAEEEMQDLRENVKLAKQQSLALKAELDSVQRTAATSDTNWSEDEEKLRLKEEVERLRSELRDEIVKRQIENTEEARKLREEIEDLEYELHRLHEDKDVVENELTTTRNRFETELEQTRAQLDTQFQNVQNELESELHSARNKNDRLEHEIVLLRERLEKDQGHLKSQDQELRDEHERLLKNFEDMRDQRDKLQYDLETLREDKDALEAELELQLKNHSKISELKRELSSAKLRLEKVTNENNAEIRAREAELQQVSLE
jgi:chromosome segregation ATPase